MKRNVEERRFSCWKRNNLGYLYSIAWIKRAERLIIQMHNDQAIHKYRTDLQSVVTSPGIPCCSKFWINRLCFPHWVGLYFHRAYSQETPGEGPHLQTAGAQRASGVECRTDGRRIQWLDATGDCFHSQSTPMEKCHHIQKIP